MGYVLSMRSNPLFLLVCVIVLIISAVTVPGVQAASPAGDDQTQKTAPSAGPQRIMYVQDFLLDADTAAATDSGNDRRLLHRPHVLRPQTSPAEHARQMVDLMAESLVSELNKAGFQAGRLASGSRLPKDGWLIGGVFTELDEGNRLKRAVIGFGSGATTMEVQVSVSDLATNPYAPFMFIGTVKDPKKMPGAVVTMNPYVAGAKFVLEKNASEKDVVQSAKKIAEAIKKASDDQQASPAGQPTPR